LEDAAPQFFGRGSNAIDGTDDIVHQLLNVERAAVGEFSLGQRRNAFIAIELRGASRKVLDVPARVPTKELPQSFTVVRGGIVQHDDDRTSDLPQQLSEEQTHLFLADVVEVKQIAEAQVPSLGAARDCGEDGDFVPASLAMTLKGGAPLGCPSPGHRGSQQKARLIGED